jgi:hypothetical protein
MAYILKDTSALINTQITDVGRKRLSQGNFNISYFQLGDSEVCYDCVGGNLTTLNILAPEYNAQNNVVRHKVINQTLNTQYSYQAQQVIRTLLVSHSKILMMLMCLTLQSQEDFLQEILVLFPRLHLLI